MNNFAKVIEQTLTDGSIVYNVHIFDGDANEHPAIAVISAEDGRHANAIADAIEAGAVYINPR